MPINDDRFSGNIENLKTIAAEIDKGNYFKEVIKALSFFLSHTNRNYYYTETYLNDQFQNFENFLGKFYTKNLFSKTLYNYLQAKFRNDDKQLNIKITIDDIWEITYKDNQWCTNLTNGSLSYISRNLICLSFELVHQEKRIEMYETIDINEENKETKIYKQIIKYYKEIAEYEESRDGEGSNRRKQIV